MNTIKTIPIILLMVFGALIATSCLGQAEAKKENIKRATLIIDAVHEYYKANNYFPEDLEDLIPTYILEIPERVDGEAFFYAKNRVDGFVISFLLSSNYGCGYSEKTKQWGCGYGD